MPIINTTDDLLSLLRENQEFREAVRQAVLTEELLALPAEHKVFVAEMREFVAEMREYIKVTDKRLQALEKRIVRLEEGQQRLEERIVRLEEGQQRLEERIVRLEEGLLRLERGQQRHTDDIGELKGIGLETKLFNRGTSLIATLLKVQDNQRVRVAEVDDNSAEFNSVMYKALNEGLMTEEEYVRILDTDMIISSSRPGSSTPVYSAIEASYGITRQDIAKVKQTASILGRIFPNAEIHPVLYYMNVPTVIEEEATRQEVRLLKARGLVN